MVSVPLSAWLALVDAPDAFAATVVRLPTRTSAPAAAVRFLANLDERAVRLLCAPLPESPPPSLRGPSVVIASPLLTKSYLNVLGESPPPQWRNLGLPACDLDESLLSHICHRPSGLGGAARSATHIRSDYRRGPSAVVSTVSNWTSPLSAL